MERIVVAVTWIALAVGLAAALAAVVSARKSFSNEMVSDDFDYSGDGRNDKTILVRNVDRESLRRALSEFVELYGLRSFALNGIQVESDRSDHAISFPRDFPADYFVFLVDHLANSAGLRDVGEVLGISTLVEGFSALGCPKVGEHAVFHCLPSMEGGAVRIVSREGGSWEYDWAVGRGWTDAPAGPSYVDFTYRLPPSLAQ